MGPGVLARRLARMKRGATCSKVAPSIGLILIDGYLSIVKSCQQKSDLKSSSKAVKEVRVPAELGTPA